MKVGYKRRSYVAGSCMSCLVREETSLNSKYPLKCFQARLLLKNYISTVTRKQKDKILKGKKSDLLRLACSSLAAHLV